MDQCNYRFREGLDCDQPVQDGRFCLFHDPNTWKTHADEIRKGIQAKIQRGDYNFEGYHFPEISFSEKEFKRRVNFRDATFHAFTDFTVVWFGDSAYFYDAQFLGRVDFKNARFQKVYFQGANFSGRAYFRNARFFSGAYFEGARFTSAHFKGADFEYAHFRTYFEDAHFQGASFTDANFYKARFTGPAFFRDALFQKADFRDTQFVEASFRNVKFSGKTDFNGAQFSGHVDFNGAQFSGHVDFNGAQFSGHADFNGAQFSYADFERTIFTEIVSFDHTHGQEEDTETITFWRGNFTSSIFEKTATFTDSYLDPCYESTSMDYSGLRDVRWPPKKKLFDEREADAMKNGLDKIRRYQKVVRTYFFLRTRLRSEGDFVDESDFLVRERLTERKLLASHVSLWFKDLTTKQKEEVKGLCGGRSWRGSLLEWFWLSLIWLTCGFGEKMLHIVATFLGLWIFFAFILLIDMTSYPRIVLKYLPDALYVSIGALSNMGVDLNEMSFSLSAIGKGLIQIEALLGIVLTSLFLVVFVRKMVRQ